MAVAFDLFAQGFPWVELTGDIKPQIALADADSMTTDFGRDNTLAYELYDGATLVASGVLGTSDSRPGFIGLSGTITGGTDRIAGTIYRERITGTLTDVTDNTYDVSIEREAYATPYPVRASPFSWASLAATNTALAGQTYSGQVRAAWYTICAWVAAQRKGVLWTPSAMVMPLRSLTLSLIYEDRATYGAASALALATYHRTAYSNAMESIRNGWDKEGDGVIDAVQSAESMGGGVGG